MARVVEYVINRASFGNLTGVHDRHLVAGLEHDANVVRNQYHTGVL